MIKKMNPHKSYMEYRDLDPITARVVKSIEKVKDMDDPDRVYVKKHALGRTLVKMRSNLGTMDQAGDEA
jgi:hypothetical protein